MLGQKMIYDPASRQVVLFGGSYYSNSYTFYRDTWSLDVQKGVWSKFATTGSPSGRFNTGMAYDSDSKKIVLFGGFSSGGRVGDTWTYEVASKTWTNTYPSNSPSSRSDPGMAYDASAKKIILFAGYNYDDSGCDDTWAYDPTLNSWSKMNPETHPQARYGAVMVYDSYTKKTLLFGGHMVKTTAPFASLGYDNEVWTYDYVKDSWEMIETGVKPPARYWHDMSYDSDLNRIVLFGGSQGGGNDQGDTWVFDCRTNRWSVVVSTDNPDARSQPSMAYDSTLKRTIMFGGADFLPDQTFNYFNDVWTLDQSGQWKKLVLGVETPLPAPANTGVPGYPTAAMIAGLLSALILYKRRSTLVTRTRP
jgi:N-acetylneuraminic acid mutarotase